MARMGGLVGLGTALACAWGCGTPLPEVEEPCAMWAEPGLYALPLEGFDRSPWIYVPATAGPRKAVVMLHGAGSTADVIKDQVTRFLDDARTQGFVAVFPNGSGTPAGYYWNAGECCGVASEIQAPDVAYLNAISATIRDRTCVDQVVAAGQSNGGMMALRWACEGKGVDGLVTSAGADVRSGACEGPALPVSMAHGTADKLVPYEGGVNGDGVRFDPAPDGVLPFLARNQCASAPTTTKDGNTTCFVYDCDVPTRFCAIEGEKHQWFGGFKDLADGFDAESEVYGMFDARGE